MYFKIVGKITNINTIAIGNSIRDIDKLTENYGKGKWRKLKGLTTVRLFSGRICQAEIHWYEAHVVGRKKLKIKKILD